MCLEPGFVGSACAERKSEAQLSLPRDKPATCISGR